LEVIEDQRRGVSIFRFRQKGKRLDYTNRGRGKERGRPSTGVKGMVLLLPSQRKKRDFLQEGKKIGKSFCRDEKTAGKGGLRTTKNKRFLPYKKGKLN